MTFTKCGVCKSLRRVDSQCHICGAHFVRALGYHIDVCTGRRIDSALRAGISTNPRVSYSQSVAIAKTVVRRLSR